MVLYLYGNFITACNEMYLYHRRGFTPYKCVFFKTKLAVFLCYKKLIKS